MKVAYSITAEPGVPDPANLLIGDLRSAVADVERAAPGCSEAFTLDGSVTAVYGEAPNRVLVLWRPLTSDEEELDGLLTEANDSLDDRDAWLAARSN